MNETIEGIYRKAVKELSEFHDWIAETKPDVWKMLVDDYAKFIKTNRVKE